MIKQGLASLRSLEPMLELIRACEQVDKYPVKLYWNLIESRRRDPQALDYLYFPSSEESAKPVGLLCAYYFQDGIEITAAIHPDFRRQGIFTQMINKVFDILRFYKISHYFLISHVKFSDFNNKCVELGAKLHHSEIEMRGPSRLSYFPKQTVLLQRASFADMPKLVELHQQCFPGYSASNVQERLSLMLKEPQRQTWIAKNQMGQPIGKLHVREDANAVFLHDLGIIPRFQQQGYASSLIYHWYQQYLFPAGKPLLIDVLSDNQAAIRLYAASGFTITNQYNFWQFDMGSAFEQRSK